MEYSKDNPGLSYSETIIKILENNDFFIPHSMSKERALLTPEFWKAMAKTYNIKSYKQLSINFIAEIMGGKSIDDYFSKFIN